MWVLASVWQCVPLRRSRLSRLCTHSPAGAAGPSHLRPVCRASSNLAASGGATGAFSVSSPQDCHESSVKSSHRLSCRPPRKLTRPGGAWGGDAGGDVFFLCVCVCAATVSLSHPSRCVRGSDIIKSGRRPPVFVCFCLFLFFSTSTFTYCILANFLGFFPPPPGSKNLFIG